MSVVRYIRIRENSVSGRPKSIMDMDEDPLRAMDAETNCKDKDVVAVYKVCCCTYARAEPSKGGGESPPFFNCPHPSPTLFG